jgi:hypothetical protein
MPIAVTAKKETGGCSFSHTPAPTDSQVWSLLRVKDANISGATDSVTSNTHKIFLSGSVSSRQQFYCKLGNQKHYEFTVTVS